MTRRIRRWGAWILGTVAVTLAVAVGVFLLDQALHRDRVARNTTLAGQHIGSLDASALERLIDELATEAAARPVTLQGADRAIVSTLADVGVTMDTDAVTAAATRSGRDGSIVADLWSWWTSFGTPRTVDVQFVAARDIASAVLTQHRDSRPEAPVEPHYTGITGELTVTPGRDGLALDIDGAVAAIDSLAGPGYPAAEVEVAWVPVPPQVDAAALDASIDAAERLVDTDIRVIVNGNVATIGRGTVLRWIDSTMTDAGLVPVLAPDRAQASVERLLSGLTDPGTPPVFTVIDGEVAVTFGEEPMRCCGDGVADLLQASAVDGNRFYVRLPVVPVYADGGVGAVEALGIRENVGEFTTYHSCCQSRVDNIHRIADLVRGVVIEPGERFSINEFIGERTREKGFVAAGVIESGHFTDDVGGGISQFATTMFNAAFFAGLDFETYRSHTIYLSRYPYGREATLSFPAPDLIVVNPTPYAMLIWTEYDDTSITVQLYSTGYYDVAQTDQRAFRWGRSCTRVNTYRSRTTPDGEVLEDFVFATYRPGEGLDCNGRATPKPTN